MGRYDKIKVYSGGQWKSISRIQVYNNGWKDLGTNTSANTQSLNVFVNGISHRATLNKKVTTNYVWCNNAKDITNGSNWSFNPYQGNQHFFRATIYKPDNTARRLLYVGDNDSDANSLTITWRADGKIEIVMKHTGYNAVTIVSSNAVTAGNWVYLNINWPSKTATTQITFNGVLTSSSAGGNYFEGTNKAAIIGDGAIRFRDSVSIQMEQYGSNTPLTGSYNIANGDYGTRYYDQTTSWV